MSVLAVQQTVRRYVQQHAPQMPPAKYDGITELWFDDVEALGRYFSDPENLQRVRPDEEFLLDLPACNFIVSTETTIT